LNETVSLLGPRETAEAVSTETVLRVFAENNDRLRDLLLTVIPRIPPQPADHLCATALSGARV